METREQVAFIEQNYLTELNEIYNSLKYEEFRQVETIIDKVNNNIFTRYCITLLIDTLISIETELEEE